MTTENQKQCECGKSRWDTCPVHGDMTDAEAAPKAAEARPCDQCGKILNRLSAINHSCKPAPEPRCPDCGHQRHGEWCGNIASDNECDCGYAGIPSKPAPEPQAEEPFDFRAHLYRQREWSEDTFGPGPRAEGVVDHIRKELVEIEAAPSDLTEWIDVAILALDGAWRAGYSPDQIIHALKAKQEKNEKRKWPDWRPAEPGKAMEHERGRQARPRAAWIAPRRCRSRQN